MQDLNHPKVKPFTRELATTMAIDPTFVDFVFARERPKCFRYRVEDVAGSWTCYVPDEFDAAYPLWSTNGDQTLLLTKGSSLRFGKGWHDTPDMEMISETTQGLLTNLMNTMVEKGLSDAELRQAADSCGYRYLDDLLTFLDSPIPTGTYHEAMSRFIAEIDAGSR